jgi:hypothetical protein
LNAKTICRYSEAREKNDNMEGKEAKCEIASIYFLVHSPDA